MKVKKWKGKVHIVTYQHIGPEKKKASTQYEMIVITPGDFKNFNELVIEEFGAMTVTITVEAEDED